VCTKDKELLNEPCKYPVERCINFGMIAQYYIDNNMGRQISHDELMDILKMGEEKGLVLSVGNAKDLDFICLCCGCCCIHMRLLRIGGHPAKQVFSSYSAAIDPRYCTSCGTCQDRCQIAAIVAGDKTFTIDSERCIGCGACVSSCPVEAISLNEKPDAKPISDNLQETFQKITVERGIETPMA
jgi:ferredoxin